AACQTGTPQQRAQKLLAKAQQDAKRGKTNRAIIEYRRAIQDDPKLAIAHFELGRLYSEGPESALDGFRELTLAVDLDSSNLAARGLLGDLLIKAGQYADAKQQA